MRIRSASHVDNGADASPRYTPNYGSWREVVTSTAGTAAGSATLPIYINNSGQVVACTASSVFSALSWTAGTTAGQTLSATIAGQNRTATIPSASDSASGVVTTGA
jgi:hypothetical protein